MNRYAESALNKSAERIASASCGERAHATYENAYQLGRLVGGGVVGREQAEGSLIAAALEAGLPEREARGHVRSGLERGMQHPKKLDDRMESVASPAPREPPPSRRSPRYLGARVVRRFWDECKPVYECHEAAAWIKSRGLDAGKVSWLDLARVLPDRAPAWATCGRQSWAESGHTLIVPLFDSSGALRSVQARAIRESEKKTLLPSGFSVHGLVFACPMGRTLLSNGAPSWWEPEIVITEGIPDFLTWALRQHEEREQGPVAFGVFAGGWSKEIGKRIPSGARIAIRTHQDAQGERYALRIASTLGHCKLYRPKQEHDDNA